MAPRVDMQVHVRVLGDDPRYTEWGRISPWLRTQPVFRTTLLYAGIAPELASMTIYALLAAVLILRPSGLFPAKA